LGRSSVDIIKSGGYKISALDVERVLLEHPDVAEAVVVGVPDDIWGQRIGALVRIKDTDYVTDTDTYTVDIDSGDDGGVVSVMGPESLVAWLRERMPKYTVPSVDLVAFVDEIPKNHMGKVNKKQLAPMLINISNKS